MSMPNFPDISPDITQEKALSMILASIAMEELAFSHILNAEGEKLQYILGTLPGKKHGCTSTEEILEINKSIERVLDSILQNQMIISNKMGKVLDSLPHTPRPQPPCKKEPVSLLLTAFEGCSLWKYQRAFCWKCENAKEDLAQSEACIQQIPLSGKEHYVIKLSLKLKANKLNCRLIHLTLRAQIGKENTVLFPFFCCLGKENTVQIVESRVLQPLITNQDFYHISLVLESPEIVSIENGSIYISVLD